MNKIILALLGTTLMASSSLASEYDVSPNNPFGMPNPEAPESLKDFAFAIGAWTCVGETPAQDGTWVKNPLDWEFHYILNGRAVQDYFDGETIQGVGIRQINPQTGKWHVAYHSMYPNYANAMWEGEKVGDDIVLDRMVNETTNMRLSFYNIKSESFEWKGEFVTDEATNLFWHISCDKVSN